MPAINYQASPTGALFHHSPKIVRGLKGPVGSGKSVTCINELHRLAVDQWPNCNGIRKTKWAIIRNTTLELRSTTLATFKQWIPEELCPIVMSPMITGTLDYKLTDNTRVEAEFLFLALDNEKDVRKLLSLEVTGVFCNEARELYYAVIVGARGRIGRYPSVVDGYGDHYEEKDITYADYVPHYREDGKLKACKRKSLLMDTNPPDDDHWWFYLDSEGCLEEESPERKEAAIEETHRVFDFFNTPAPLIDNGDGTYSPAEDAENIDFLDGGYDYYLDQIAGSKEDYIKVMILGHYGAIVDGKPVYPEYRDTFHCPDRGVNPIKGLTIELGWDFGLTPACVITQLTPTGQMRVIVELFTEKMGIRQFARTVVKPYLARNFKGFKIGFSVGDPSGKAGEGEGRSCIMILNDEEPDDGGYFEPLDLGFTTDEAPTNDITKRLEAVRGFLTKLVDNGQPGYVIDKRAKILRKGKQGKYNYQKMQVSGGVRYQEKPRKDKYSHPADAEQYVALGYLYGYQVDDYDDDDDYDPPQERNSVTGY